MPIQGRYAAVGFSIGSSGYVGTGYTSNNQPLNDFWEYHQLTNSWTQKANVPVARSAAISFSINGYGYIGLGLNNNNHLNDLHRYNPLSNSWTTMTPLPGSGRYGSASFSTALAGYVVCGNLGAYTGPYSSEVWKYDPLQDTWSLMTPFPGTERYGSRAAAVNGYGYVIGGGNESGQAINYNTLHRYDPATDSWLQLPDYPGAPPSYPVCFQFEDGIVVGSGNYGSGSTAYFFYFNAINNSWILLPPLPAPARWAATAFQIMAQGYVATGHLQPSTTFNDLWELTSTTGSSELSNNDQSIRLFPNPSSGIIFSSWPSSLKDNLTIQIFDTKGVLVYQNRLLKEDAINLSHLIKGIYLIKIIEPSSEYMLSSLKISLI